MDFPPRSSAASPDGGAGGPPLRRGRGHPTPAAAGGGTRNRSVEIDLPSPRRSTHHPHPSDGGVRRGLPARGLATTSTGGTQGPLGVRRRRASVSVTASVAMMSVPETTRYPLSPGSPRSPEGEPPGLFVA